MLQKSKYLSEKEQLQLLNFWKGQSRLNNRGKRTYALIQFALGTGLRASEIADTKIEDLHLRGEFPLVEVQTLKNGDVHPVYISNQLARYLKGYIRGHKSKYLFPSETGKQQTNAGLWNLWQTAIKKAGLPHFPLHATRHSFACNIYRKSKDIILTQHQLRHKSISSTQIYADVSVEQISETMNQI